MPDEDHRTCCRRAVSCSVSGDFTPFTYMLPPPHTHTHACMAGMPPRAGRHTLTGIPNEIVFARWRVKLQHLHACDARGGEYRGESGTRGELPLIRGTAPEPCPTPTHSASSGTVANRDTPSSAPPAPEPCPARTRPSAPPAPGPCPAAERPQCHLLRNPVHGGGGDVGSINGRRGTPPTLIFLLLSPNWKYLQVGTGSMGQTLCPPAAQSITSGHTDRVWGHMETRRK